MNIVTYTQARNDLKSVIDRVVQDSDITIISRKPSQGDAVLMSLADYNALQETLFLLSSRANASILTQAIAQDRQGLASKHPLAH